MQVNIRTSGKIIKKIQKVKKLELYVVESVIKIKRLNSKVISSCSYAMIA